jgi:hypothetical protein
MNCLRGIGIEELAIRSVWLLPRLHDLPLVDPLDHLRMDGLLIRRLAFANLGRGNPAVRFVGVDLFENMTSIEVSRKLSLLSRFVRGANNDVDQFATLSSGSVTW